MDVFDNEYLSEESEEMERPGEAVANSEVANAQVQLPVDPKNALAIVESIVEDVNDTKEGFVYGEVGTGGISNLMRTLDEVVTKALRHTESMVNAIHVEDDLRLNYHYRQGINDLGDIGVNVIDFLCKVELSPLQESWIPKVVWLAMQKITSEWWLSLCFGAILIVVCAIRVCGR